jgi:hypothetical protein
MASIRRPAVLLILLGLAAGPAFAGRSTIDPDGNPAQTPSSSAGSSEGRSTIDPDG